MKKKSNEEILDEYEKQNPQQGLNNSVENVQDEASAQSIEDAYQKYDGGLTHKFERDRSLNNGPEAGVSLGETQAIGNPSQAGSELMQTEAGRVPQSVEREPATRKPVKQLTGTEKPAVQPQQTYNGKEMPIDGTYVDNLNVTEAKSAPEYTPKNFDSTEAQGKARIKESNAILNEGARQQTEGKIKRLEEEAKALEKQHDFYLNKSNVEVQDAEALKKLDTDREFWKAEALKKQPPRGWGEKIADAFAIFGGGMGLKPGQENQVYTMVMNKIAGRTKEYMADKKNAIEVINKLNSIDPRIQKTPQNIKIYMEAMANKAMDKLTEAKLKRSQIPEEQAKLSMMNAKFKAEANNKLNELESKISKQSEDQRLKERKEGMTGAGMGLVYKPEQIRSQTDVERSVYFPDGSGQAMLAKDQKTARAMAEGIDTFSSMNKIVSQVENYIKNTPNTQKLLDASGKTKMAGVLASQINSLANITRKLAQTGVLNMSELPFVMASIPKDPTSIINKEKMIGQIQEMKRKNWDAYKRSLIDAGLIDQKTRQPSGKWSRFK